MKQFVFFMFAIFMCIVAYAQTETINWYMDDGTTYTTTTCESGGDIILPQTPTKRGYTFVGWTGYTPIEYLESTGTQYIDTEVVHCGTGTTVETKFSLNSISSSWNSVYGASTNFAFTINPTLQQNSYQYNGWSDISAVVDINVHKVRQANENFYIDGNFVYSRPPATFFSSNKMLVFSRNAGDTTYSMRGKIYYFKLWKNDILVRDFIPVLDINGTPCMYDKVEKKFYYNAGTGQFVAGPIINE